MATLWNKRKLAAISRETPEGTRNSRAQNALDSELTQDYISEVSEEVESKVTKKLSKELSRTESRILGALSKLDEFLLNPQDRTCSVAVPGTSRNNNSENRETTGDRSSDEVRYFSHHSGHLNSPEAEKYPQNQRRTRSFLGPDVRGKSRFRTSTFSQSPTQKASAMLLLQCHGRQGFSMVPCLKSPCLTPRR